MGLLGQFFKPLQSVDVVLDEERELFTEPLLIRLSKTQLEMIKKIASVDQRSKSAVIRMAIVTFYEKYQTDIK